MTTIKYYGIIFSLSFLVTSCETRTYEDISEPIPEISLVNYNEHVKPIMSARCTSCHSTTGIASFAPLENYNQVKSKIDQIIDRIERPDGDYQKMPQGGSLSQADISVIKQWKTDGLLEQ